MARVRSWWTWNLAGAVMTVGVAAAVNRASGATSAVVIWSVAAVSGQVAVNVLASRQDKQNSAGPPVPSKLYVPDWVVDREQVALTVAAVCTPNIDGHTVGITTALRGAGGFGKTMVASMVRADPRVRRYFAGRTYLVTVGRDVRSRSQIAAKVAEATRFITGDASQAFEDPVLAGEHLGRLLEQAPRTLLVIDDVWEPEQLGPFLSGAPQCVRLVTTRAPGSLPSYAVQVAVDSGPSPGM